MADHDSTPEGVLSAQAEHLEFVRKVPLFTDLTPEEFAALKPIFVIRDYVRGDVILHAEETGRYMYVVNQGRVKATKITTDGKEVILAIHGPGDFFGEMALLDGKTSPATVISMEKARVIMIAKKDFDQALVRHHSVIARLMQVLCLRCRDAWVQVETMAYYTAAARIKAMLLWLVQKRGVRRSDGMLIDLDLTHQNIADMAGISREKVTRVLRDFQARNLIIAGEKRRYIVPDPEALAMA